MAQFIVSFPCLPAEALRQANVEAKIQQTFVPPLAGLLSRKWKPWRLLQRKVSKELRCFKIPSSTSVKETLFLHSAEKR